jgi:ABC-type multidrug transport system fused ATPase/permease subunit
MITQFTENIFPGLSQEMLAILVLVVFCIVLLIVLIMQNRRITRLMRSTKSVSIEDTIIELAREIDTLNEFKADSEKYLKVVEKRLRKSVQAIETKRFNPFKGTGAGGNQSFACAFVNENGDGLILSSLYSSDRMSVYAKPVEDFKSTYELTEEEEAALVDAKKKCQLLSK